MNNPQVFEIRKLLTEQILELKNQPQIDLSGQLSQIDALINQIGNLPLPKMESGKVSQKNQDRSQIKSNWRAHLQNSVHALEKLVVIKKHDSDIRPILSPLYRDALLESIRMNLQEAQWALLHSNNKIYKLALQQAQNDIKRSFDNNHTTTKTLLSELQKLERLSIGYTKPDFSDILERLNQAIRLNKKDGGQQEVDQNA
jgi:uroporphyrin-3 C-methyltransferase